MDTAHALITYLSEDLKLSDSEIARRASSSQPTIWRLRTGETKDCSSSLYISLMKIRDEALICTKKAALNAFQPLPLESYRGAPTPLRCVSRLARDYTVRGVLLGE